MDKICRKCGYYIHLLGGTWFESYDNDDVCYDEDTNRIGDGKHYPEER